MPDAPTGYRFYYKFDERSPAVEVTTCSALDFSELLEAFRAFCLACGYHPDTVERGLGEE